MHMTDYEHDADVWKDRFFEIWGLCRVDGPAGWSCPSSGWSSWSLLGSSAFAPARTVDPSELFTLGAPSAFQLIRPISNVGAGAGGWVWFLHTVL